MKKLPFGKVKKKKLRKLKNIKLEAWSLFSEFIRRRDENNGCVTCGVKMPWKEAHAGHFIHGHSGLSFMDERNVNFQCPRCNHFLSGNLIEYTKWMDNKYGWDVINELQTLKHTIWKPSRQELENIIGFYQDKLNELDCRRGEL